MKSPNFPRTAFRAIKLSAVFLFALLSILSCRKEAHDIGNAPYVQDKAFFQRNGTLAAIQTSHSADFVDTVIRGLQRYDMTNKVVEHVKKNYGYPRWNESVALKNDNGFKTLVTPVVRISGEVSQLIVSYQLSPTEFIFKAISRENDLNYFEKVGDADRKRITSHTINGLFESLQNRISRTSTTVATTTSSVGVSYMANITETIICWYYVSYSYSEGQSSITVSSTQCATFIEIDEDDMGRMEDIGGGGGDGFPPSGNGGTPASNEDTRGFSSEEDASNAPANQLSCKSFAFTSAASNWQEAGVSGLQLVGDWFGPLTGFILKPYGDIFVGVPKVTSSGRTISPSEAAIGAASAANKAGQFQAAKYHGMDYHAFARLSPTALATEFRTLMAGFLSDHFNAGCTVTKLATSSSTIVKKSDWTKGTCE